MDNFMVWPASKVDMRELAGLVPYAANARTYSKTQVDQIAAEITGRVCHAIELNSAYVDVAVDRWQNFTGKSAELEGKPSGTFDELLRDRAAA